MQARQFMTKYVITVSPTTSVHDAAIMLVRRQIAAAPVVDDDGRLRGIVSEADLLLERVPPDPTAHLARTGEQPRPRGPLVRDVMTTSVLALPPSADAAAFAALMIREGVRSIPVIDEDRVVGIVSRRDILTLLCRGDDEIRFDLERRLDECVVDADAWKIDVRDGFVRLAGQGVIEPVRALALAVPGVVGVEVVGQESP